MDITDCIRLLATVSTSRRVRGSSRSSNTSSGRAIAVAGISVRGSGKSRLDDAGGCAVAVAGVNRGDNASGLDGCSSMDASAITVDAAGGGLQDSSRCAAVAGVGDAGAGGLHGASRCATAGVTGLNRDGNSSRFGGARVHARVHARVGGRLASTSGMLAGLNGGGLDDSSGLATTFASLLSGRLNSGWASIVTLGGDRHPHPTRTSMLYRSCGYVDSSSYRVSSGDGMFSRASLHWCRTGDWNTFVVMVEGVLLKIYNVSADS